MMGSVSVSVGSEVLFRSAGVGGDWLSNEESRDEEPFWKYCWIGVSLNGA